MDTHGTKSILPPGVAPGLGTAALSARSDPTGRIASLVPSQPVASQPTGSTGCPVRGAGGPSAEGFGLSSEVQSKSSVPVKRPAWRRSADQQDLGGPAGALVLRQRLLEVLQLVRPPCTPRRQVPGSSFRVPTPFSWEKCCRRRASIAEESPRKAALTDCRQCFDFSRSSPCTPGHPGMATKRFQVKEHTWIRPSNCQDKHRRTGFAG